MQTEDAGVKSSHPHFKFKKGNDMNDTVTKGNAAALLPIGVFLLILLLETFMPCRLWLHF